jgi:hypothetical protein
MNEAYKVFAKVLRNGLCPNTASDCGKKQRIQHHKITTHHSFIDLKAAYTTITRNEIYGIMAEVDFPAKLIRITQAKLTTVRCCIKIQNDCLDSFKTLFFNFVLEAIVRRAKLQTTGTIFNKQTQFITFADDIDIVARSLEVTRDAYL